LLVAVLSTLGVASSGISGAASALPLDSCGPRASSTAFAPWGDPRSYFLMPGGGFERGARGWTPADDSEIVRGNEAYFVGAATDRRSAQIVGGTIVVSPTICVALGESWIRFFVNNPGVAGSVLHLDAYVQDRLTGLVLAAGFDVSGGSGPPGWAPSSPLLVPNLLGGVTGTQNFTLVFTTRGVPAAWGIDDVFVDPFKSR
jgi:hypothetical protein